MPLPQLTYPPSAGSSANTLQDAGQNTMANSHPVVIASDQTPVPIAPPLSGSTVITAGGAAVSMTSYSAIVAQIDALSGGDAVAFSVSTSQAGTYYPAQVMSLSGTFGQITPSAAASGQYSVLCAGLCWIKATKTGSASTPVITLNGG